MMAILNSLSFRLYISVSSVLVSGELSFSFCSELLLQFLMVFDELIFCQSICIRIRLQIPTTTSGWGVRGVWKELCFLNPQCLLEVVQIWLICVYPLITATWWVTHTHAGALVWIHCLVFRLAELMC